MTDRKRDPLPKAYRFGNAGGNCVCGHDEPSHEDMDGGTHECHLCACEQFVNPLDARGWNVIEGDHFTTDRDHGDEA